MKQDTENAKDEPSVVNHQMASRIQTRAARYGTSLVRRSCRTAEASQCAGPGLISSVLGQIGFERSADKTLINGVINIWSWIIDVTAALLIPKVKRRVVFLSATSDMLVTFIIWTALSGRYIEQPSCTMGVAVVAMIFLYDLFYRACWLPLVVAYPFEKVTTKQRGLFFSWTMFCINASSFVVSHRS